MTRTRGWSTKIAVLFIFLLSVEVSLINTALGEIAIAFPDASPVLINLVSTTAVIFMFAMTLVVGRLAARYDKKALVIIALVIYIIGGVGGFFLSHDISQILFCRALVGIGAGISAPLVGAIITELYEGSERATMLGWSNAFSSFLAVLLTMLAGWLAAIDWRYTFLAYGVFIAVLLLEVIALPKLPPPAVPQRREEKPQYTRPQKIKLALIALFVFVNLLVGMLLFLKMPIMVTNEGIGGPVQIAFAFSASTTGVCISAFGYGLAHRIFKRYTLAVYLAMTACAFLIVLNAYSMPLVVLGFFINGLANGMFIPSIQMKAIAVGPEVNVAYAMSVAFAALFLGQFVATFVEKALAVFGDPTPRTMMLFGFIMFSLYTVAYLIWTRVVPEGSGQDTPSERTPVAVEG